MWIGYLELQNYANSMSVLIGAIVIPSSLHPDIFIHSVLLPGKHRHNSIIGDPGIFETQSCTLGLFNLTASIREIEAYFERLELSCPAHGDISDKRKTANFLDFIGKLTHSVNGNLSFPQVYGSRKYEDIKIVSSAMYSQPNLACIMMQFHLTLSSFTGARNVVAKKCRQVSLPADCFGG